MYTITATAIDNNLAVSTSSPVMIHVDIPNEIKNHEKQNFELYPNPASNVLTIETKENAIVQLLSIDGKMLLLQTNVNANEKKSVALDGIANGTYLVKVYNNSF